MRRPQEISEVIAFPVLNGKSQKIRREFRPDYLAPLIKHIKIFKNTRSFISGVFDFKLVETGESRTQDNQAQRASVYPQIMGHRLAWVRRQPMPLRPGLFC